MRIPDKITKKTVLKIIWIVYALVSMVVWVPQIDKMFIKDYASDTAYLSLDDGWDIAVGSEVYRDVSLGDFRFGPVRKGDRITMQKTLPGHFGLMEGVLRFHIRQSAVRMYIDGELVYEYGYDRMAQNKTVGSGFQFINFPNGYQGKTLEISLFLSEDLAFAKLDSMRIYEWEDAYRMLLTENRIPLFFGCFLAVFGLVINIITVFALAVSLTYIRAFCISLEDVKRLEQKTVTVFYRILAVVHTLATAWMIGLHALDIVHCAATLKYMQVLIVLNLVFFIFVEVKNLKQKKIVDRMFLVVMVVIAA